MRFSSYFLMILAAGLCLGGAASFAEGQNGYVVEEKGQSTVRFLFDKKMKTSAEQWSYARETQNRGWLKKADQRMLYLVRRWPNSKEAPWAARARADMLFAREKAIEAFNAYQFLIDNYSSRMLDYDGVLENQFGIAATIMDRRRMRWVFGGYRAPEYAIVYFEKVIRNGPQWKRAAEAQMLIGKCYQESDDLEMAIASYDVLGYRYPDSAFAEEAAWQQIACLDLLRKEYPNNMETLDRLLTSTTIFLSTYPASAHKSDIIGLRNAIYEVKADRSFAEAEFYETVSKKVSAAVIYYEKMIEEYPLSELVPKAQARIDELKRLKDLPTSDAAPVASRSKPLPFTDGK